MELGVETFLMVCPLLFLAGLIDAIGGGGGLISLPAYLLAGLPPHAAIATNKMSSTCGTAVATARLIRHRLADFRIAVPSVAAGIIGSSAGARLSLLVDEKIMLYIVVIILPICAFLVLNKKLFHDSISEHQVSRRRMYITAVTAALLIGVYDGFYGPGTGTFLIIAFTVAAKMNIQQANAQTKIINLTTNITSLIIFLLNGQVVILLGLAAAVCNMIGGYIGAGLMMEKGSKIVRPSIIFVLILLFIKILADFFD